MSEKETPHALSPPWEALHSFFEKMLDEFHSQNLLRRNISETERERLNQVWENSRNYETALGDLFSRFKSEGKQPSPEEIAKKCAEVGLAKDTLDYLFLSQLIGSVLLEFESMFKTSLLFFLEAKRGIGRKMTLGDLLNAIKRISPPIGKKLNELVDIDLRNNLAHGTFWFRKGTLFLAEDSYLRKVKEVALGKLFIELMSMSIAFDALVHALKQKEGQGYFRS